MITGELLMVGTTLAFVLSFLGYSFVTIHGRQRDSLLAVVVTLGFVSAGQFALFSFSELVIR